MRQFIDSASKLTFAPSELEELFLLMVENAKQFVTAFNNMESYLKCRLLYAKYFDSVVDICEMCRDERIPNPLVGMDVRYIHHKGVFVEPFDPESHNLNLFMIRVKAENGMIVTMKRDRMTWVPVIAGKRSKLVLNKKRDKDKIDDIRNLD